MKVARLNGSRKGFTLIELLVVIAIIAILAAILFPVFTSAKKSAQATACMNSMKQISLAHQLYMDNYNGYLVPSGIVASDGSCVYWDRNLSKYLGSKDRKILNCPAASGWGIGMSHPTIGVWSPYMPSLNFSKIAHPGKTVCFADSAFITKPIPENPDMWTEAPKSGTYIFRDPTNWGEEYDTSRVVNRHNGKADCSFLDGHCQAMPVSKLGFNCASGTTGAMWDIY